MEHETEYYFSIHVASRPRCDCVTGGFAGKIRMVNARETCATHATCVSLFTEFD